MSRSTDITVFYVYAHFRASTTIKPRSSPLAALDSVGVAIDYARRTPHVAVFRENKKCVWPCDDRRWWETKPNQRKGAGLPIGLVQKGRGVSRDGHGRALDHGAGRGPRGHPAARTRLLALRLLLLQPLLRHLAPVHRCVGGRPGGRGRGGGERERGEREGRGEGEGVRENFLLL